MIFVTSDFHLGHKNLLEKYQPNRSHWPDVEAMNNGLLQEVHEKVGSEDELWFLGDLFMAGSKDRAQEFLRSLVKTAKRTLYIPGNHDKEAVRKIDPQWLLNHRVILGEQIHETKLRGRYIVLCHYPIESWPRMVYGAWHLHGHQHGHGRKLSRRMDISWDAHNRILTLEEIGKILDLDEPMKHHGH